MLREMNVGCRFSACVDWALGGSQAVSSFLSAPCSFPAIVPPTAMTASQNKTITYFMRRPEGIRAMRWAMDLEPAPGSSGSGLGMLAMDFLRLSGLLAGWAGDQLDNARIRPGRHQPAGGSACVAVRIWRPDEYALCRSALGVTRQGEPVLSGRR